MKALVFVVVVAKRSRAPVGVSTALSHVSNVHAPLIPGVCIIRVYLLVPLIYPPQLMSCEKFLLLSPGVLNWLPPLLAGRREGSMADTRHPTGTSPITQQWTRELRRDLGCTRSCVAHPRDETFFCTRLEMKAKEMRAALALLPALKHRGPLTPELVGARCFSAEEFFGLCSACWIELAVCLTSSNCINTDVVAPSPVTLQ